MATSESHDIENDLLRAHLLVAHGKFDEARDLLRRLEQVGASRADIDHILREIETKSAAAETVEQNRRDRFHYLGLNSSAARIKWTVIATAALVYSIYNGVTALSRGQAQGFSAVITTKIYSRHSYSYYTHPIYVDLIISIVVFVLAAVGVTLLVLASKGVDTSRELDR